MVAPTCFLDAACVCYACCRTPFGHISPVPVHKYEWAFSKTSPKDSVRERSPVHLLGESALGNTAFVVHTFSQGKCSHFDGREASPKATLRGVPTGPCHPLQGQPTEASNKRDPRQLTWSTLRARATPYKGSPPQLALHLIAATVCVVWKRHPRQLYAEYPLGRATPYKGSPPKLRTSVTQGNSRGVP